MHPDNYNRNGKQHQGMKMKQPIGNTVDKIVSCYQVVSGGQMDEHVILNKCRDTSSSIEKVEKEIDSDIHSGQLHECAFVEELQGQHAKLRGCIEQLTSVESARASLVSNLREALKEQEYKLAQICSELQIAQSHSEQADDICRQLLKGNHAQLLTEQNSKEAHTSMTPPGFITVDREQSAPVMYAQQVSFPEKSGHNEEDPRKSAAAAVAAKLTASTSSAQMLSYVLSSLASEGIIGNSSKENCDFPPEKRSKLENDPSPSYVPPQNPQEPPVPPFLHPDSLQQNITTTPNDPPPPPPPSPPPIPPQPPMHPYLQNAPMTSSQFSYNVTQHAPGVPGYPSVGTPVMGLSPFGTPPTNHYQSFQGSDGNFYTQPSSMPMAPPISRQ